MEVVGAFWCQEWIGFFLALLSGILGVVLGLMLLGNPIQGGITLTVLLASFLFVGGIFKAVAAIAQRFEGWGWLLLSSVIDVALGVMIWRELPMSGLTIIGVLVGISIIFRGSRGPWSGSNSSRFRSRPLDIRGAGIAFGSTPSIPDIMLHNEIIQEGSSLLFPIVDKPVDLGSSGDTIRNSGGTLPCLAWVKRRT